MARLAHRFIWILVVTLILLCTLLSAFLVSLQLGWQPAVLTVLAITTDNACSVLEAVNAPSVANVRLKLNKKILDSFRLLETDGPLGLYLTSAGKYWLPNGRRSVEGVAYTLAEQEQSIYGHVKPGDIVIDCGANIGLFVRRAIDDGASLVVAVEPTPIAVECIRRNFAPEIEAGKVILFEGGVSDREGSMALVTNENSVLNAIVEHGSVTGETVEVSLTPIDSLIKELKLPRVDFIKIDVNGVEDKVIIGASGTLQEFHPRLAIAAEDFGRRPGYLTELARRAGPGYRVSQTDCTVLGDRTIGPDVLYLEP